MSFRVELPHNPFPDRQQRNIPYCVISCGVCRGGAGIHGALLQDGVIGAGIGNIGKFGSKSTRSVNAEPPDAGRMTGTSRHGWSAVARCCRSSPGGSTNAAWRASPSISTVSRMPEACPEKAPTMSSARRAGWRTTRSGRPETNRSSRVESTSPAMLHPTSMSLSTTVPATERSHDQACFTHGPPNFHGSGRALRSSPTSTPCGLWSRTSAILIVARQVPGSTTRCRSDPLLLEQPLEPSTADRNAVAGDLPLVLHPAATGARLVLLRPPSLDRPKAEFFGFDQGDRLVMSDGFLSVIWALLPIAPCGRSSL